ncbi:MAG TPA: DUF4118 domain-containing protein, partial [Gemmatimonadaceae bacterium]
MTEVLPTTSGSQSLGSHDSGLFPSFSRAVLHPGRPIIAWIVWLFVTAGATVAMYSVQHHIDQAHVVLLYLLIVLGASASGGRALGFTLAVLAFVLIDYLFQPPYNELTIGKPLDWLVLITFFTTSIVATQLLARARSEAIEARARAVEVTSLSQLASETLNAGRAEDALVKIVDVIQTTLGVAGCTIWPWSPERGFGERITREGV